MTYCSYCDAPLTEEERKFNGSRCRNCERKKRERELRSDRIEEQLDDRD